MTTSTKSAAMKDPVFERLLLDFNTAEKALETYLRESQGRTEDVLRSILTRQLQQALWTRYGALCERVRSRRQSLEEL